jgi:hypothetical protein
MHAFASCPDGNNDSCSNRMKSGPTVSHLFHPSRFNVCVFEVAFCVSAAFYGEAPVPEHFSFYRQNESGFLF